MGPGEMLELNATQIVGLLSFGVAFILACVAWRCARDDRKLWGWIAFIHAVLLVDVFFDGRHAISGMVKDMVQATDLYSERRIWQFGLLVVLALVAWIVLKRISAVWRRGHRNLVTIAAVRATLLTLTVFALEIVSLHQLDAELYRHVGPVLLIGWLWASLAAVTSVAALAAAAQGWLKTP